MAECLPILGATSRGGAGSRALARLARRLLPLRSDRVARGSQSSGSPRRILVTRRLRRGQAEQALVNLAIGRYLRHATTVARASAAPPARAAVDVLV